MRREPGEAARGAGLLAPGFDAAAAATRAQVAWGLYHTLSLRGENDR